jgi:hypothetical protein
MTREHVQLHLSINQKNKYLTPFPSWGKNIDWHKTYLINNKSTMIRKKLNRLKP